MSIKVKKKTDAVSILVVKKLLAAYRVWVSHNKFHYTNPYERILCRKINASTK